MSSLRKKVEMTILTEVRGHRRHISIYYLAEIKKWIHMNFLPNRISLTDLEKKLWSPENKGVDQEKRAVLVLT